MSKLNDEAISQRRNLVILSILLALYYVIGREVEVLGLALDQIAIAEPIAWIAVAFFFWRHWVHAKGDRGESLSKVGKSLSKSPRAQKVGRVVLTDVAQNARVKSEARQQAIDAIPKTSLEWKVRWFSYQCAADRSSPVAGVHIERLTIAPWIKVAPAVWWIRIKLALTTQYIDPWLPYPTRRA